MECYEGIKNDVFQEHVITQKNVHSMSTNDNIGLTEQNDPTFFFKKKKSYTHTYICKYTQRHTEGSILKC